MIVRFKSVDGSVAGQDMQLWLSTQDAVDLPMLMDLFHQVPKTLRARLTVERQGDYADANLYVMWPKEGR